MLDRVQGPNLSPAIAKWTQPAPAPEAAPPAGSLGDSLLRTHRAGGVMVAPWAANWGKLSPDESPLKLGAKGEQVKALQELLVERGHLDKADGNFGPKTLAAVKAFQAAQGLKDDGVAGPNTKRAAIILQTVSQLREMVQQSRDPVLLSVARGSLDAAKEALARMPEGQEGPLKAAIQAGYHAVDPWAEAAIPQGAAPEVQEDRLDQFNDVFGQEQLTWT